MMVAHAGVGSKKAYSDATRKALRRTASVFKQTGNMIKSVIAGVVILENDPRLNAGTGSVMRLDGSIQMDAAVTDSRGNFGGVVNIEKVRNPILVAYEVMRNSPHLLLAGQGAVKFARKHGFKEYDPATPATRRGLKLALRKLKSKSVPAWAGRHLKHYWQTRSSGAWVDAKRHPAEVGPESCDTVGIVLSDGKGRFAAAVSTGGTAYVLPGRIGDSPIIGSGLYTGKYGAVVATGVGEEILRKMLAREVYEQLKNGMPAQAACEWGVKLYPKSIPIGLIAVTRNSCGVYANWQMASAYLVSKPR
jgi:isoaspartyl peptidase/L-asparaginase-like protein (Ntn-hydrolase superfamily)